MRITELISLDDESFLREAFRLILGREIDHAALADYRRTLARGRSKEQLLANIAASREASERLASPALLALPPEAFIDAAYVRMLGRNADPTGMQGYLVELRRHDDRLKILREIGRSEEARRFDASGWALREELEQLLAKRAPNWKNRARAWLGWPSPGRLRTRSSAALSLREESDRLAGEPPQVQQIEYQALKDQVALIASALDGLTKAQRRDATEASEQMRNLSASVSDLIHSKTDRSN